MRAPRETMALSPDGTRIVFVGRAADPGTRQLYTRRLDEIAATPIPATVSGPSLSMPTFSPAGDWVAYVAGNAVRKVPVQGGSAFVVAETAGTPLGISWGDDDGIVIGSTQGLLRVPSSGGTPERLKTTDGTKFLPQALPGSTAILMGSTNLAAGLSTLDDLSLEVFDRKTGQTKALLPGGYAPRYVPRSAKNGYLLFIRQGTLYGVSFDPERLAMRGTPVPLVNDVGRSSVIDGRSHG
jgi:Tol biopolymer transport system component